MKMRARLTVLYLVAVSLAVFLVRDPRFVPLVLVVHLIAALWMGVRWREIGRSLWRLRILLVFLVVMQAMFPPRTHFVVEWLTGGVALSERPSWEYGAAAGVFQVCQIFAMVLVSTIVRTMGNGRAFVEGMRGLFVPASAVEVVDACFGQLQADRKSKRRGRGESGASGSDDGGAHPIHSLLAGDVGWIVDRLEGEIGEELLHESDTSAAHDVRLMTRVTMVLMSLRLLRLTPGTGLTPGFQNVAVIPLLCLAADRTTRRWSAGVVGAATGVLSIMLGLGRNGVFILPAHILPGIVIDIGWRIVGRGKPTMTGCAILGALAGFTRFTGMMLVLLLLDNPELLAAVPVFSLGHVVFGGLSSLVTMTLIRESRGRNARNGDA